MKSPQTSSAPTSFCPALQWQEIVRQTPSLDRSSRGYFYEHWLHRLGSNVQAQEPTSTRILYHAGAAVVEHNQFPGEEVINMWREYCRSRFDDCDLRLHDGEDFPVLGAAELLCKEARRQANCDLPALTNALRHAPRTMFGHIGHPASDRLLELEMWETYYLLRAAISSNLKRG